MPVVLRRPNAPKRHVLGLLLLATLLAVTLAPRNALAAPPAQVGDVVLDIRETEINAQLDAALVGQPLGRTPLGDVSVERIAVELGEAAITVRGAASAGWMSIPMDLTATPRAVSGQVRVDVGAAHLGGVALPAPVCAQLAQVIQDQINLAFGQRGFALHSVAVERGRLVAAGTFAAEVAAAPPAAGPAAPSPTRTAMPVATPTPTLPAIDTPTPFVPIVPVDLPTPIVVAPPRAPPAFLPPATATDVPTPTATFIAVPTLVPTVTPTDTPTPPPTPLPTFPVG